MVNLQQNTYRCLELRPPRDLATALAGLSDDDFTRLLHAVAVEERQRNSQRREPHWTAASLFRKATGAALMGLLMLPLSGCALGLQAYEHYTRYTVEYADPNAWNCADTRTPTGSRTYGACVRCQNISGMPQSVTFKDQEPQIVAPAASVMSCQSKAWIVAPETATPLTPIKPPSSPATKVR